MAAPSIMTPGSLSSVSTLKETATGIPAHGTAQHILRFTLAEGERPSHRRAGGS
jgi:hypothetical protein